MKYLISLSALLVPILLASSAHSATVYSNNF